VIIALAAARAQAGSAAISPARSTAASSSLVVGVDALDEPDLQFLGPDPRAGEDELLRSARADQPGHALG
jgi:hypothetical protein